MVLILNHLSLYGEKYATAKSYDTIWKSNAVKLRNYIAMKNKV